MNAPSKNRRLKCALLAVAVAILVSAAIPMGLMFLMYRGFSAGNSRGLVEERAKWPEPVRDLIVKATRAGIDVEPVQVFGIRDFTEEVFYWRMRSSPELIALMVSEWKLTPGIQDNLDDFWRAWPSEWKVNGKQGRERLLENCGKPSDNFVVIVNESQPIIYGYYYFNF